MSLSARKASPSLPAMGASPEKRIYFGIDTLVLILVLLYLLIPLGTAFAFGISNGKSIDLSSYQQIFSDGDFYQTLLFSLGLSLATTFLTIIVVTPTAYWVQTRLPQARPIMDILALVPFAMPAIVMALGLVQVYGTPNTLISILSFGLVPLLSNPPFNVINTPPLLVCAYLIISLPFVYRPIDNSLRAINTQTLTEAAYSLGCGWWKTFFAIILPNILPGVISAALLTFSTAMGEFTLASLFSITTFPIYLNVTGQSDPHKAASLTIVSFTLTLICVLAMLLLVRRRSGGTKDSASLDIVATK
ncbi:ABC transporter permease [Dictyobacter aurantiacus]|uniref:Spermidine/putrescine ABC transporter permease n=1 Tax=Dictyobacter aurantiacus TaxID=1936993 RepID=A0A401ZQ02_9CHLR|nr:ABC transporter permease subunit [Dictyobacter aurantiacus]GCE08953.1 spermidine/putrescine ABC transporter permease [Dictyobacter aurantiacus]